MERFVIRAKSLGLNVFYGMVDKGSAPVARWNNAQGDYTKFLKLAKELGVSMVLIGGLVMQDFAIDSMKLDPRLFNDEELSKRARELLLKAAVYDSFLMAMSR